MTGPDAYRGLGWAHGALTVQRLGAQLAPLTFVLPDGRQVSPLHIAPWAAEPESGQLPGILRRMRGEWPCVPFGYSVPNDGWPQDWAKIMGPPEHDEEAHGHCSNTDWNWGEPNDHSISMVLDYPPASPVARVERSIVPDPDAAAIDLTFTVHVRRACRLPIGLHPVFRLPAEVGAAHLELGTFDHGRTYPDDVEPSAPLFARDVRFTELEKIPARTGGMVDASRLPFAVETEELLQIEGLDGTVALANHAEGYRTRLTWRKEHFPSLLLWYSNRGRKMEPWRGRNISIGIEPICSPFGLGSATATADNPIARSGTPTALAFSPDTPFVTQYRIEAEAL